MNLSGSDHFIQLGLVLQVQGDETSDKVKTVLPQIRNRILLLLASKTAEDLDNPKGKEALIAQLLADARAPLGAEAGTGVEAVLLGSMIIQ